jgi:hypothetical protein
MAKILIIGAGSSSQGTGPYLSRFFHEESSYSLQVLGKDPASAQRARKLLKEKFSLSVEALSDWNEAFQNEKPAFMVIASPAETHRHYLQLALQKGLPVFCEKPLIWDVERDNRKDLENLIENLEKKPIPLMLNTQWNETFDLFKKLYPQSDFKKIHRLDMHLSPKSQGQHMLIDALPHAWSFLIGIAGLGQLETFEIDIKNNSEILLHGNYRNRNQNCSFHFHLKQSLKQPRYFAYAVNQYPVERILDMEDYSMAFKTKQGIFPINDPVRNRIKRFLSKIPHQITSHALSCLKLEMQLLIKSLEIYNNGRA